MTRSAKRSGARQVGSLLSGFTHGAFARRGFREPQLLTEWSAIVGPDLAARCQPEALLRSGTLRLRTDGATALLMQHMELQICDRIAVFCGYRAVKRLSFRHEPLPPRHAGYSPGEPAARQPSPQARRVLATVADTELRAALARLGCRIAGANGPGTSGREK